MTTVQTFSVNLQSEQNKNDSYDLNDICSLEGMFNCQRTPHTIGPIGSSESFGAVVFSFATLKTFLECTSIPSKSDKSEANIQKLISNTCNNTPGITVLPLKKFKLVPFQLVNNDNGVITNSLGR